MSNQAKRGEWAVAILWIGLSFSGCSFIRAKAPASSKSPSAPAESPSALPGGVGSVPARGERSSTGTARGPVERSAPAPGTPDSKASLQFRDASGAARGLTPVQYSQIFAQGEIREFPQAFLDGAPVETQADVKSRWPDGSVKQAILSFIAPSLKAGASVVVRYANQKTGLNEESLSASAMLEDVFDFEASMELKSGSTTLKASARKMISEGAFTYWIRGKIATTVIIADHSAARKYDVGFDVNRSFRPIFHATFWPALHRVKVRWIGEASNTEAMQDLRYSLTLRLGQRSPQKVYEKDSVLHYAATRWTREAWQGESSNLALAFDFGELSRTRALPRFSPALAPQEDQITETYDKNWKDYSHDLYDGGWWERIMPNPAGRVELAPYPLWSLYWLYSGDGRMQEITLKQSELAGAWPVHYREGSPEKFLDRNRKIPGLGRVLSISTRPSLSFMYPTQRPIKPADQIKIASGATLSENPWRPDVAHQPSISYVPYLLTGDFWHLEEMWFWASWTAASGVGDPTDPNYGRGPTGAEGGYFDQSRAEGWMLRNRAETAFISPDGSDEKAYFTTLIDDVIAMWEGQRDLRGSSFEGNANWTWGNTVGLGRWTASHLEGDKVIPGSKERIPPLHFWEGYNWGMLQDPVDPARAGAGTALWMQNFVIYSLARANELGYPSGKLLSWLAPSLIDQINHPSSNAFAVGAYRTPTLKMSGELLLNWGDMLRLFKNNIGVPGSEDDGSDENGLRAGFNYFADRWEGDSYPYISMGAAAMAASEPGGVQAWNWLYDQLSQRPALKKKPLWGIIPRDAPGAKGASF